MLILGVPRKAFTMEQEYYVEECESLVDSLRHDSFCCIQLLAYTTLTRSQIPKHQQQKGQRAKRAKNFSHKPGIEPRLEGSETPAEEFFSEGL